MADTIGGGRVWDASEAGGRVELSPVPNLPVAGRRALSQKLLRYRGEHPTMVAIELRASLLPGSNLLYPKVMADINWQVGRGTQSGTIEIGHGTVFTVCAAEVVDITARCVPLNDGGNVEVVGTAAPAAGISPMPATTSTSIAATATVESAAVVAPDWTRRVRVYPQLATNPVVQVNVYNAGGGALLYSLMAPAGAPIDLFAGAQAITVTSPLNDTILVDWEQTL